MGILGFISLEEGLPERAIPRLSKRASHQEGSTPLSSEPQARMFFSARGLNIHVQTAVEAQTNTCMYVCTYERTYVNPCIYIYIYSTHIHVSMPACIHTEMSLYLSVYLSSYLPTHLPILLSIYTYVHMYVCSHLSISLSFYLSIYLSDLSVSPHLSLSKHANTKIKNAAMP